MPRVSIVTPTYNHAEYIGAAIASVQAQSVEDWEMIIVDDGSSDATRDRVIEAKESRVKLIAMPNRGLSKLGETYNIALREAKADVIGILEGDDLWPADKLERQLPDFDDKKVVLSSGMTEMIDAEENRLSLEPRSQLSDRARSNLPVGSAVLDLLNTDRLTYTFPVSTLIRADALSRISGFQQPYYLPLVDLPTLIRIALEGEFRFHDEICGRWRRHQGSTTRSRLPMILDGVHRLAFDFLTEHGARVPASPQEIDSLDDQWASYQAHRLVVAGRWLTSKGKMVEARRAFKASLAFRGGLKRKAKARIGLLGTFGIPVEFLFSQIEARSIADEIELHGDSMVDEVWLQASKPPYDLMGAWKAANP